MRSLEFPDERNKSAGIPKTHPQRTVTTRYPNKLGANENKVDPIKKQTDLINAH